MSIQQDRVDKRCRCDVLETLHAVQIDGGEVARAYSHMLALLLPAAVAECSKHA